MKDYFLTGYIQRLIDFMWDSQLVKFYNIIYAMYMTSFLLILSSVIVLAWQNTNPYVSGIIRAGLMSCNLLVLVLSLCTFEIKSLLEDGLDYFKSFYNLNDMCLFALSVVIIGQEYNLLMHPDSAE